MVEFAKTLSPWWRVRKGEEFESSLNKWWGSKLCPIRTWVHIYTNIVNAYEYNILHRHGTAEASPETWASLLCIFFFFYNNTACGYSYNCYQCVHVTHLSKISRQHLSIGRLKGFLVLHTLKRRVHVGAILYKYTPSVYYYYYYYIPAAARRHPRRARCACKRHGTDFLDPGNLNKTWQRLPANGSYFVRLGVIRCTYTFVINIHGVFRARVQADDDTLVLANVGINFAWRIVSSAIDRRSSLAQ